MARRTRTVGPPVGCAKLRRQVQTAPVATELVGPDRGGFVVQREALIVVADAVMHTDPALRALGRLRAGHGGGAGKRQTDKAGKHFLLGRQHR
ncbi:hypothetical protein G6F31_021409 [Rhizopus arrhizus]|nr:hypothetical protein G6F31_021409 [Rhizopus arrhizus]